MDAMTKRQHVTWQGHRNESQDVTDLMDLTWEVREELRAPSVSGKNWGLVNPSESSQAFIF